MLTGKALGSVNSSHRESERGLAGPYATAGDKWRTGEGMVGNRHCFYRGRYGCSSCYLHKDNQVLFGSFREAGNVIQMTD